MNPVHFINFDALVISCKNNHYEIIKELLHAYPWKNIKFINNYLDNKSRNIINAEIFIRSVEKESKGKPTKSYADETCLKFAIKEKDFVKMRATKIYSTLTKETQKEKFIKEIKVIGLTKDDLIEKNSIIAKNPNAFTDNIGSNFNNNNSQSFSYTPLKLITCNINRSLKFSKSD